MEKILIVTLLFWSVTLEAQTDEMHLPFEHLDFSYTNTNILIDYGLEFSDLSAYSGATGSDTGSVSDWRSIYASLQTGLIKDESSFVTLDEVNELLDDTDNLVDVPVLAFEYDRFDENAVTNGLFTVTDNQLYDVAGRSSSPYIKEQVYALAPEQSEFTKRTVEFRFRSDLYFTNKTVKVQYMLIDFGDGQGYQTVNWDESVEVYYSDNGTKTIRGVLIFTNWTYRYCNTEVVVDYTPTLKNYSSTADLVREVVAEKSYLGAFGRGTVSVAYGENNGGVLRKPLIIAEGFDPSRLLEDSEDYDYDQVRDDLLKDINLNNLLESGNGDGYNYDLVFLNYDNGTDYIQRNAYLLEEVINWVNENKVGNEPNVVVGLSMGGLVARYALADMEQNGSEDHDTRLYISIDSPHRGANVPLSLQYLLEDMTELSILGVKMTDRVPELESGYKVLTSAAAQQMLVVQTSPAGNQLHQQFMQKYQAMGYPRNCKNIAVSNGSVCGAGQPFSPGDYLFRLNSINIDLLTRLILGAASVQWKEFDMWAKAMPSHSFQEIYRSKLVVQQRALWGLINTSITLHDEHRYSMLLPAYDNAPGGSTGPAMFGGLDLSDVSNQQVIDPNLLFCFVPSASAFDIPFQTTADLQTTFGRDECILQKTPFDWVLGSSGNNTLHVDYFNDGLGQYGDFKGRHIWRYIEDEYRLMSLPSSQTEHIVASPVKISCSANVSAGESLELISTDEIELTGSFNAQIGSEFSMEIGANDEIQLPAVCNP